MTDELTPEENEAVLEQQEKEAAEEEGMDMDCEES